MNDRHPIGCMYSVRMDDIENLPEALDVTQVAELIGMGRQTVVYDINKGLLPALKIGVAFMVRGEDARVYIQAKREYLTLLAAADKVVENLKATMKQRADQRTAKKTPRARRS